MATMCHTGRGVTSGSNQSVYGRLYIYLQVNTATMCVSHGTRVTSLAVISLYWPGLSNPGQVLSCLSFSEMGTFFAYGNRGFPKIPTSLIFKKKKIWNRGFPKIPTSLIFKKKKIPIVQ